MADMADNLVTLIDEKWSGPAKPDIIEKVIERPDWGRFGNKDMVTIFPLGSGRHIHVTRDYYNVIYGFEIFCHTPTSSDRLKELYEEVIDILYNWYLTGVDKQRVVDQKDVSDKKTGKFKYTIHIEIEAIMVYKGAAVSSGIPAGEGTYTATALRAESDEEIDIMDNSGNLRAKFTGLDDANYFALEPHLIYRGGLGSSSKYWLRAYIQILVAQKLGMTLVPTSDNAHNLGSDSLAWDAVYAYDFVDKTPAIARQDAIDIINSHVGDEKGNIDHEKLHPLARSEAIKQVWDEEKEQFVDVPDEKVYGRKISVMISALVEAIKSLSERIEQLEVK